MKHVVGTAKIIWHSARVCVYPASRHIPLLAFSLSEMPRPRVDTFTGREPFSMSVMVVKGYGGNFVVVVRSIVTSDLGEGKRCERGTLILDLGIKVLSIEWAPFD